MSDKRWAATLAALAAVAGFACASIALQFLDWLPAVIVAGLTTWLGIEYLDDWHDRRHHGPR